MPSAATTVPTRDRILFASAELFRRQGYAGTGLKQIVTAADAPFGSLYHFFPGGKEQLGVAVLEAGGAFFLALYHHVMDAEADLLAGLDAFFAGAGETVVVTDFQDACPIATVAGEIASTHPALRVAAAGAFGSWLAAIEADLRTAGVPATAAAPLALQLLGLIEGAFLLCRTQRSRAPMLAAGAAARTLVHAALLEV